MGETCNFCQEAIDNIREGGIQFQSEEDRDEALMQILEAWGKCFKCGEDRTVCYPLIKLAGGLE